MPSDHRGLFDVVIVGGGPAGSAAGRLLASWGHAVLILAKPIDPRRGLAESLPPSSRKLLAALGVLDSIEAAGFCRGIGNAVWWGERAGELRPYAAAGEDARGFQVFRPDLDALLLEEARRAGVSVVTCDGVRRVDTDEQPVFVDYHADGCACRVQARFVIDASGRAGVIGRRVRRYEPRYRMQALVGVWERPGGWGLPDESYTFVEMCEEGWTWSIPCGPGVRHIVTMVDGGVSRVAQGSSLDRKYHAALAASPETRRLCDGARLRQTWARDASIYDASIYAGDTFLLVGDAGARIDPLSSFGVKKALASAWAGAIAVHTALIDEHRRQAAFAFFDARERDVYAGHLRQSRDFAREAQARHPHPFWQMRAEVTVDDPRPGVEALGRADDVQRAFERLAAEESPCVRTRDDGCRAASVPIPIVRGHEIVLEPALVVPGLRDPLRHLDGVDLWALCELARDGCDVPTLFERYSARVTPVPLPALLRGISLLVSRGLLATGSPSRR